MHTFVANFLNCNNTNGIKNWSTFDSVITKIKRVTFFLETQCTYNVQTFCAMKLLKRLYNSVYTDRIRSDPVENMVGVRWQLLSVSHKWRNVRMSEHFRHAPYDTLIARRWACYMTRGKWAFIPTTVHQILIHRMPFSRAMVPIAFTDELRKSADTIIMRLSSFPAYYCQPSPRYTPSHLDVLSEIYPLWSDCRLGCPSIASHFPRPSANYRLRGWSRLLKSSNHSSPGLPNLSFRSSFPWVLKIRLLQHSRTNLARECRFESVGVAGKFSIIPVHLQSRYGKKVVPNVLLISQKHLGIVT